MAVNISVERQGHPPGCSDLEGIAHPRLAVEGEVVARAVAAAVAEAARLGMNPIVTLEKQLLNMIGNLV
jgi:hypothetical protein